MRQVSRRPHARHHNDRVHLRPRARVLGRAQLADTARHRCGIARRARADCPLTALAAARTACRNRRLGGAAPRHPSLLRLLPLWAALGYSGYPCRAALPSSARANVADACRCQHQARPLPHLHGVSRRVACLDPVSRGGLARTHVQRLVGPRRRRCCSVVKRHTYARRGRESFKRQGPMLSACRSGQACCLGLYGEVPRVIPAACM